MSKESESHQDESEKGIEVLHSWSSPDRIWKPKTQVWYLSSAAVVMVLIFMAARWGYWVAILALIAFLMLWFVQGTLAPWTMEHRITSKGFFTHYQFFRWDDIDFFWFGRKEDRLVLYLDIDREVKVPRLLLIVEDEQDQQKIFDLLIKHLKYGSPQEIGYNFVARWIYGEYLPITLYIKDEDQPEAKPKAKRVQLDKSTKK